MFSWYQNIKNNIDFFLRNKFKVSREGFYVENEPKDGIFQKDRDAFLKEDYLFKKYNLGYFKKNSPVETYLLNLSIVDLLENNISFDVKKEGLKILDIGSKNWFYVQALYAFFKAKNEFDIELTGIELDAYRVYSSFYSRYDAARFYMKNLDNVKYIAGDFLEHKDKYDYITWFYPFVSDYPLLKWGLPLRYLKPVQMLEKAYKSLNKGAEMIIINQNQEEYDMQRKLFEKLSIPYEQKGEFKSDVYKPDQKRFVSVIKSL